MDTTEIKQELPDSLEVNPTDDDDIKLEFSEIGEPVPCKIKCEVHDEDSEPNIFRMELPVQAEWIADAANHQAGPSNVDQLATDLQSSSSPPPNKRIKTEPKGHTRNKSKHNMRSEKKNGIEMMSSDDDSFSAESNMEYGGDGDSDSECQYMSDDDPLGPGYSGDQGDPQLDCDNVGDLNEDSWWRTNQQEWTTDDTSMRTIHFTKKRELLKPAPKTPYETFRWLLNDQLLDTIVEATNKYGYNMLTNETIAPSSRCKAWKEVTREELVTFLALLIHTGTIRTNRMCDYWKGDYLFNLNCFSRFMTRNRFMLILNFLNFTSPDTKNRKKDKTAKVRPFVKNFNDVMKQIYHPGKELLIAKSIVIWHGHLVRQDYTDHRRHKNAVNLFKLAEPNGIVLKYQVFVGDSQDNIFRVSTGDTVEELVADHLGCGHSVYMDKYYSSYRLALTLLNNHTYCTGILSKKTRCNPFRNADHTTQEDRLSKASFFFNGVHIGQWRGRKTDLYITTEFKNELNQVIENNGTMNHRPKALVNFSRFMTGSELQDQLMSYIPCSRKKMCWYKKVFIFALQIYMNNAFHLFNNFSGNKKKMGYYEFRLAVLKAMLPVPMYELPAPMYVPPAPLPQTHQLTRITRTRLREKKEKDGTVRVVNEVLRRECKPCRRVKRRTATLFECAACEGSPAYCTTCFCEVHVSTNTPYTMNFDLLI